MDGLLIDQLMKDGGCSLFLFSKVGFGHSSQTPDFADPTLPLVETRAPQTQIWTNIGKFWICTNILRKNLGLDLYKYFEEEFGFGYAKLFGFVQIIWYLYVKIIKSADSTKTCKGKVFLFSS
jgi:hypothetical protein